MSPLAKEWVEKAEADLATASRELAAAEYPNYDAVCFHAQQCAEKYLKGVLEQNHVHVPKTHDLGELLELLRLGVAIGPASPRIVDTEQGEAGSSVLDPDPVVAQ